MSVQTHRNVLIIAYAFWPVNIVGAIRPLRLSAELLDKGYRPKVLTMEPWDEKLNDYEFERDVAQRVQIERVRFRWPISVLRKIRKTALSRLDSLDTKQGNERALDSISRWYLGALNVALSQVINFMVSMTWTVSIVWRGQRIARAEHIDCVFCTAPPNSSLVPASVLAWLIDAPLVADFRDLWTLHEYAHSASPGIWKSLSHRIDEFLEGFVLRRSKSIIYNTPTAKLLMDDKYPSCAGKSFAITNGIPQEKRCFTKDQETNGCFTVCHIGALYNDRNPSDFFKGLRQWLDGKDADFERKLSVTFVGRGSDEVEKAARNHGLKNVVRAYGQKTREELPGILGNADVFLLCLGYRETSRYVIPAKMYDYIGAEKPVIAFAPTGGEVFNLMRRLGLDGNVVTSPDSATVTAILEREYQRCTSNGNQYAVSYALRQEYEYSTVSQRIERVISRAIERHASKEAAA